MCTTLGEYPIIRFYRPKDPPHEAGVLCSHLARFVQEGLDQYAAANTDFPPQSQRPRGVLLITDRSMDLYAPLIHEFSYQAMVHELLPLKDGDKTFYRTLINKGQPNEEKKDMELGERDRLWVDNRHLHMKDLLEKLVAEFNKFRADNPQFAEERFVNLPDLCLILLTLQARPTQVLSTTSKTCWQACRNSKKAKTCTRCI